MNQSIIYTRYAKALFQVGLEKGCLENIHADMEYVQKMVKEVPALDKLLKSPVIKPEHKRKALSETICKNLHEMSQNLLGMLIHNRREGMLADIARRFMDMYDASKNIVRASVTTAVEIDEAARKDIEGRLSKLFKAEIELKAEVEPELIGGFLFRVGDNLYDATVKRGLAKMRSQMVAE